MEKINIAELLKDCPKGMELDCTMYEDVTFDEVEKDDKPICIRTGDIYRYLTKYGTWSFDENAKCVIFPKGKTTWEGFHRPFKDGDVVATKNGLFIGIVNIKNNLQEKAYCAISELGFSINIAYGFDRLATEEEKQKLFQAIKDNGYKWNAETKTLEKLPKFKVGDIVQYITDNTDRRKIEEIDTWCNMYHTDSSSIMFEIEDEWALVPNKFDISTLESFAKVLVRDNNTQEWFISFFSHDNGLKNYKYSCINGSGYAQCVPYEENKHLRGTTNDCDEYYKTWEK